MIKKLNLLTISLLLVVFSSSLSFSSCSQDEEEYIDDEFNLMLKPQPKIGDDPQKEFSQIVKNDPKATSYYNSGYNFTMSRLGNFSRIVIYAPAPGRDTDQRITVGGYYADDYAKMEAILREIIQDADNKMQSDPSNSLYYEFYKRGAQEAFDKKTS